MQGNGNGSGSGSGHGMGRKNNKSTFRLFSLSLSKKLHTRSITTDHHHENTILDLSHRTVTHIDPMLEEPAAPPVLPPPSDRFFVSPSASGSLACGHYPPLHASSPSAISDEMASVLQEDGLRSYCRFFASPSSSGLIALDPRAKPPSEPVTSSTSSNSNSTKSDALTSTSSSENGASSSSSSLVIAGGGIAVSMDSDDPYGDFRRSMQEMVHGHAMPDWDFLEDLLSSYLELNDSSVHRHIITAFADMVAAVLPCDDPADGAVEGGEHLILGRLLRSTTCDR